MCRLPGGRTVGMNLGDGLLFHLDNGKPKLILLSHGVEKTPLKGSFRPRAATILSARQPSCVDEAPPAGVEHLLGQPAGRRREARSRGGGGGAGGTFTSIAVGRRSNTGTSKTHERHIAGGVRTVAKLKSDKLQSAGEALRTNGKAGRPSTSVKAGPSDAANGDANGDAGLQDSVCLTNEQLQQLLSTIHTSSNGLHPPQEGRREGQAEGSCPTGSHKGSKSGAGGRGGEGGETGSPGSSLEKEKRSSRCVFSWMEDRQAASRDAAARKAQWRRDLDEQVALKQQRSVTDRLQAEEDADSVRSVPSSRAHRDLPAAIRSSLTLGEVTPMEEMLSTERREEQKRRWLEELDCQREETSERRRREKLQQNQAEDLELWATHFDSMQRRPPPAPPLGALAPPPAHDGCSERGEWEPSSSLSLVWEAESVGRASMDTMGGYTDRNSYLRTMTSLLDPAQVEERERKRLKQQEQQRAIEAQMEERRLQKEQEEARRRRQEQEEDRRVTLERKTLQRQFELDTQKERMKDMSVHQDEKDQQDVRLQDTDENKQSSRSTSYRDTAVQTEAAERIQTPDVSVRYAPPPPPPPPAPPPPPTGRSRAGRTGKENICVLAAGGRGGGGEDPYELFARTEKTRREKRRPEWNTQRPNRQFVPASERYPAELQRTRQESRRRRQEELLALQERTCLSRTDNAPPPARPPPPPDSTGQNRSRASSCERGRSPVPALTHRSQSSSSTPAAPPVLDFVPYVRTDEIFNLDPLEPADTPPPVTGGAPAPQSLAPPSHRDQLLHAELLRRTHTHSHTHRQEEILRGLAQLRQGLLQKQRELESDLNLRRHDNQQRSPSTTQRM